MRYLTLFIFVVTTSLYAQSCYTVQLTSSYNSKKNYDDLSSQKFDTSCKVMEIGKTLAVRCGCFETVRETKPLLKKLKKDYKDAYIASTYKHRFNEPVLKNIEPQEVLSVDSQPIPAPVVIVKENTPLSFEPIVINEIPKKQESIEKPVSEILSVDSQPIPAPVVIAKENTPLSFEPIVINEIPKKQESIEKPVSKEKKVKKKKKKKKSKKKKKIKYSKKRDSNSFYSRYLDKLESKKPSKNYGYKYRFGAQLSYDIAYIDEAHKAYTANDWRRIRAYHRGSFFDEKLFYELEYSFSGDNKYKDMYVGYKDKINFLDKLAYRVKFGNIKIPFSLETYSSSKNITFIERALTDVYADGRKLGAELLLSKKLDNNRFNLFGAIYSNSMDERVDEELDKPGYAMRFTYAYKFNKNHMFCVGSAFMNRSINGENKRYRQGSESEYVENRYISVRIKDVDTTIKKNIEALYINNKFSLQAEYTMLAVNAKKDNYNFYGYYLQGSYFVIGEGRRYKFSNSTLAKPRLNRDGALEVAFRYSHIDLNDKDEVGGAQTDYTYGLNWYYNNELKFMFNYVTAEPKGTDDYDGRLQILQARALFAF